MYRSHNLHGCSGGRQCSSTFYEKKSLRGLRIWVKGVARAPPPAPRARVALLPESGGACGVLLAPVAEVASRAGRRGQGFTASKRQGPPRLPCWAKGSRAAGGPSRALRASTAPAAGSP